MCVIMLKKPGIIIPFEKIESACTVNADGYGISILNDDKTLTTYREYNTNGNNPKTLYDIMERHNDKQQYIHLRFTTQGEKVVENCHPFNLITDGKFEVNLMHNGTLSYHGMSVPKGFSDTRAFAEGPGKKFTGHFYKLFGQEIVNHPDYNELLKQYLENRWYFLTYDNLGNYEIMGKDAGTWMDDNSWWASNTYSFNSSHRVKTFSYKQTDYYQNNEERDWSSYSGSWQRQTAQAAAQVNATGRTVPTVSTGGNTSVIPFRESQEAKDHSKNVKLLGHALKEANKKKLNWAAHTPPVERPTFCELLGLDDIKTVMLLEEDEIFNLVSEIPEAAALLIMDLLYELYYKQKTSKEIEKVA